MARTKLHPNQFQVNQAWIAFQLNDEPVETEQDGLFDVICLMDAASCFIFGTAFVRAGESDPSEFDARRLLKAGWVHKKQFPTTLFLPRGQCQQHCLPKRNSRRSRSYLSLKAS